MKPEKNACSFFFLRGLKSPARRPPPAKAGGSPGARIGACSCIGAVAPRNSAQRKPQAYSRLGAEAPGRRRSCCLRELTLPARCLRPTEVVSSPGARIGACSRIGAVAPRNSARRKPQAYPRPVRKHLAQDARPKTQDLSVAARRGTTPPAFAQRRRVTRLVFLNAPVAQHVLPPGSKPPHFVGDDGFFGLTGRLELAVQPTELFPTVATTANFAFSFADTHGWPTPNQLASRLRKRPKSVPHSPTEAAMRLPAPGNGITLAWKPHIYHRRPGIVNRGRAEKSHNPSRGVGAGEASFSPSRPVRSVS